MEALTKIRKKGRIGGTCHRGVTLTTRRWVRFWSRVKIANELENFSGVNVTVLCLAGGYGIQKRGKEHNGFAIHYQTYSASSLPPLRSLFLRSLAGDKNAENGNYVYFIIHIFVLIEYNQSLICFPYISLLHVFVFLSVGLRRCV